MPPPSPRFTSISDLQAYLSTSGSSAGSATVLGWQLASAERMVERYCRRHFAPAPALRTDYQRQVVSITGLGQTNTLQLAGSIPFTYGANSTSPLPLPITAAQLQAALVALGSVGAGNLTCAGGPLPAYPISVYLTGKGQSPSLLSADSSGLSGSGVAVVTNAGFDSNPPLVKKFTTRGKTEVRVPDLRLVDAAPDPRLPTSGGVWLYGQRLLPNQYSLGYDAYAEGGADEAIGSGDFAEPADHIVLGFGYGMGMTLAQQFAYVLPQAYLSNDLWITGRWGWNPVPPDIVDATYAVAARRYRERDAAFSDQMVTPEGISLAFFKTLPSSAQGALQQYRVPNIALV